MPIGAGPVAGMDGPERGMDDELWAANFSQDQLVDIASHIRRELIAAGQERTKNGWLGPTPPGRNVNFTLRRNLRWWFRPLDGGTRYNDVVWRYDNNLSHRRKTVLVFRGGYVSIMDHDIDMEAPPTPYPPLCWREGSRRCTAASSSAQCRPCYCASRRLDPAGPGEGAG